MPDPTLTNTNLDGVTNATINGVLADNAAASRTAIGLGTAATKTANWINVKDHGAVGNGVADDTVAIQSALDACGNAGGGTVYLPAGIYRHNKTIQSPLVGGPGMGDITARTYSENKHSLHVWSNTTVQGDGPGATVLKPLDSALGNMQTILTWPSPSETRVKRVTVRDLTIDGNQDARFAGVTQGEDEGINFKYCDDCYVHNVVINNVGEDALDTDYSCLRLTVSNCQFLNNYGNGIHVDVQVLIVTNCYFYNNGHVKAALAGVPEITNWAGGVDCRSVVVTISNCVFKENFRDIVTEKAQISNCAFYNSSGRSSVVSRTGDATLSNCFISIEGGDANSKAVHIVNGGGLTLSNCRIESSQHGIVMGIAGGTLIVTGGYIQANGLGVDIKAQSNRVVLTGARLFAKISVKGAVVGGGTGGGSVVGCVLKWHGYGTLLDLENNCNKWIITDNYFGPADNAIRLAAFGGGPSSGCIIRNNISLSRFDVQNGGASTPNLILGNRVPTIQVGGTGNTFESNEIITGITYTYPGSVTDCFQANVWRGNFGAGTTGLFFGTTTLSAGVSTISSVAVSANCQLALTLKSVGGTIAGQPYVNTITPGVALTLAGGGASNNSVYNWTISER